MQAASVEGELRASETAPGVDGCLFNVSEAVAGVGGCSISGGDWSLGEGAKSLVETVLSLPSW